MKNDKFLLHAIIALILNRYLGQAIAQESSELQVSMDESILFEEIESVYSASK